MPPSASSDVAIAGVEMHPETNDAVVEWTDGYRATYPAVALRHACECTACRMPLSGQRLFDLAALGASHRVAVRGFSADRIELTFDDVGTHDGFVSSAGLRAHQPTAAAASVATTADRTFMIPRHQCGATNSFARDLVTHGVAIMSDLPAVEGEVLRFADELGFVRVTNYGISFDVATSPNPDNLAYSSVGLAAHTDNPYRDPCPSVQLLHCIRPATSGGESVFVDGFAAVQQFRSDDPEGFGVLSSTPVQFRYQDADADLAATAPIIDVGPDGAPRQIRFNNRSMQSPIASGRALSDFYRAYLAFSALLSEPAFRSSTRLEAGELVALDNRRVLHGRTAFEIDASSEGRLLQGCYIDIDAVRSLVAVDARL